MASTNGVLVRTGTRPASVIVMVVLVALAGLIGGRYLLTGGEARSTTFPHSAAMEDELGIRFSRVAVVGAGGLVTVSYVVLDAEKAARFQADVAHPPVLDSESRDLAAARVSLMKQGHNLRAGQTYYLVYQNTRGALRSGERVTIRYGTLKLKHARVL